MTETPLSIVREEAARNVAAATAKLSASWQTTEGYCFPPVIDSTMRGDWKKCKHNFYEAHIRHLRGQETNVHLHFGGCFAKGIEVFRKNFYTGKGMPASIAAAVQAIIIAWGNYRIPANVPRAAANKTLEACLDAFLAFLEKYPPESDPIVPLIVNGEPAVEFSFAIPIPYTKHPDTGHPILYAGRFDMLAKYGSNSIFIDDEKTTTQLGETWNARWKLSGQFTGYCWGAREYGFKVSGALIRGLSILTRDIGHAFVIEQRPAFLVERFVDTLIEDVEDMISAWHNQRWTYNFDASCSAFGGCPYQSICLSNDQETWRKNFRVAPWDPLGRPQ